MPRIFVLTGPDVGLEVEVRDGSVFGRNDDCAVRLRDGSVSRRHAKIVRAGDQFEVIDLGSRNGISTVIEGRVERRTQIVVENGSEFMLGNVRVRFVDSAAASIDEIELEPSLESYPVASSAAQTIAPGRPLQPTPTPAPAAGAARKRAIATKEGVLQFERIEDKAPSIMSDDFSQYGLIQKIGMFIVVLAVAGGLFYGASLLVSKAVPGTPEAGEENAAPENR